MCFSRFWSSIMHVKLMYYLFYIGQLFNRCEKWFFFPLQWNHSGSIERQMNVCIYSISLLNLIAQFQSITKARERANRTVDWGGSVRIFLRFHLILNLMRLLCCLVKQINIRHTKLLTIAKSLTAKSWNIISFASTDWTGKKQNTFWPPSVFETVCTVILLCVTFCCGIGKS